MSAALRRVVTVGLLATACSSTTAPAARPAETPLGKHPVAHTAPAAARLVVSRLGSLPHGLSRTVAVVDGRGRILLLGGLVAGDTTTDEVLALDPVSGLVSTAGRLEQRAHDASGAYLDGHALVFGGGAATGLSVVQEFAAGSSHPVGRLDGPRSDSAAAVLNGVAYVAGGFSGSVMDRTIEATRDGVSIHPAGTLALGVRYPAVAAAGGYVWIVGGQLATTESTRSGGQTRDIQRYDPSTGRTTVIGHLPVLLGHATAFALGGAVYVAGGRTGTTASAKIWRIDPATGRASIAGQLPIACSDMAAVVIGATAYLIGGETTGPLSPLRSVFALHL